MKNKNYFSLLSLISVINASKDFGIKNLFREFNLHIEKKERLGLIGPNGSGKSTILKVIAGIESIQEGERKCLTSLKIKLVNQDNFFESNQSILEAVLEGCGKKKELLIEFNEISKKIAKSPKNKNLLKKTPGLL